jgi:glycosyltransferase involved in cell wall biosynthesis
MRVVLLTTNLAVGGAEWQVAQLAARLRLRGCDVAVVSLIKPTAYQEMLAEAGVEVYWRRGWGKLRPQVLHTHLFHANIAGRLLRLAFPVPVVISTLHSAKESSRRSSDARWRDCIYRATDGLADAVVAVSSAVARRHEQAGAASASKLHVIPNGVDTQRFRRDAETRRRMREQLGLGDRFVWLAVGRLMWKKGYGTLLEAAALIKESVLLIAGEGPLREKLEAEAGPNVRFLGARRDVAALMNAADGLVLSSVVEGLPVVLLEAAASGLACVATDVGGVAEAVVDGRTGFVVPVKDATALAAAMRRMMALPAGEREAMGCAAAAHARENFDWEIVAARWERLYARLLESEVGNGS